MGTVIFDGLNWVRHALESRNIGLKTLFQQQFGKMPDDTHIWVWEGKGGNQRRRKEYPEYKMNRVKAHEDIFKSIQLFRDALAFAPTYQIHVDGYEGDDVVASLARWLSLHGPVQIWSTDKDFRALCENPDITCSANQVKDVDDEFVHLYKTLVGDPSDNIKGLKGFGHRAFLDCDQKYLNNQFRAGNFSDFIQEFARISAKHFNQLKDDEQRIRLFWRITEFFEIPQSDLVKGLTPPVEVNMQKGLALFNKYLVN